MAKPTDTALVRQILDAKETGVAAQVVGGMFNLSAETVRRIWRRETHRKVDWTPPPAPESLTESFARLTSGLAAPEGKHDDSSLQAP